MIHLSVRVVILVDQHDLTIWAYMHLFMLFLQSCGNALHPPSIILVACGRGLYGVRCVVDSRLQSYLPLAPLCRHPGVILAIPLS